MKRSTLLTLLGVVALLALFAPPDAFPQSPAPSNDERSKQDQVIRELLAEVHQLRIALQRISVNAYRGQVMLERLRSQQEHVGRLTQQLNSVRNEIAEVKSAQMNIKERLDEAEKQQEKGLVSDEQIGQMRTAMSELKRREQSLGERETQLAVDLDRERANLDDLNKRLDALEREMWLAGQSEDSKANQKR